MNTMQCFVRALCLFFMHLKCFLATPIDYMDIVFYRKADKRLSYASSVHDSRSAKDCVASCAVVANCLYVSYSLAGAQCELSDKKPNSTTITLDVVSGWDVYVKGSCDYGWYLYNDSCYFLVQEPTDWETAKQACQSLGAHLIDIQTEEENVFITDLITSDFSAGMYWIGANDIDQEGTFTWSDGSPVSVSFTAWSPGQPDNGGSSEHCVHIYPHLEWNDIECNVNTFWRICEK